MRRTLASLVAAAAFPAALPAQVTTAPTEIWTGGDGTSSAFMTGSNWADGTAPASASSTIVVFGPGAPLHAVTLPGALTLGQIQLQGDGSHGMAYFFTGDSILALHGGLTTDFANPQAKFDSHVTLALAGDQTFALQSGTVYVDGVITDAASGTGRLTVTNGDYGRGTLVLSGANTFSGGLELAGGTLQLSGDSALGTGAVTISSGSSGSLPTLQANGAVTVKNDVTLNSAVAFQPAASFGENFTFAGKVTLDGPVQLYNWQENPIYFDGAIGEANEPRALQIGAGVFVLSGANQYTGGTQVGSQAAAVFASSAAVPAKGSITANDSGYIGIAFGHSTVTSTVTPTEAAQTAPEYQAALVARLDPANFFGTLGFDTDPGSNLPDNAYAGVDVSVLVNLQGIGSLTRALIKGPITLGDGQSYRFGGGGGTLNVSASLFDQPLAGETSPATRTLKLDSPYDSSLTLALQGENTFSGGISVTNSVLIIDGARALPANGTVALSHGYFGFTTNHLADPTAEQIAAFFGRVLSYDSESIFGFDSVDRNNPRTISSDIDLSFGNTRSRSAYLGTATKVVIEGQITPGLSSNSTSDAIRYDALHLAAVKEGHLVVNSLLDERIPSLVIGTSNPLGDAEGTVELNGANTFTGGTTLQSGTLLVGNDKALGSGVVKVNGGALGLDHGVTLANSLTFTAGTLMGYGTFAPDNGAITVGPGQTLSPGNGIGTLSFATDLIFAAGGTLDLELGAPTGVAGTDWDLISVSTKLAITASSDAPFVINLLAGDAPTTSGGADEEVIYGRTYTFTFAEAANGVSGFTSTDQFLINATQLFANTGIADAVISVTLENNSLVLNFTPVPEPSTYALLAVGLGIVGVAAWRQRRRG